MKAPQDDISLKISLPGGATGLKCRLLSLIARRMDVVENSGIALRIAESDYRIWREYSDQ